MHGYVFAFLFILFEASYPSQHKFSHAETLKLKLNLWNFYTQRCTWKGTEGRVESKILIKDKTCTIKNLKLSSAALTQSLSIPVFPSFLPLMAVLSGLNVQGYWPKNRIWGFKRQL